MLSTSAFNALLKTLEEPPPHVKFIFATTEIRKVPVTVLSRCQRFDLRRIEPEVMIALLRRIAGTEGADITDDALALITRAAEGSARDATSLLDQAISHGAGETGADQVRAMLGLADRGRVLDLFEMILRGDAAAALAELQAQYADGADPLAVLRDLAEITHWISIVKITPEASDDPTVSPDERTRGSDIAARLPMRALTRLWQMLLKTLEEVSAAPNAMMAAEMAIIRLTHVADLPDPEALIRKVQASVQAGEMTRGNAPAGGGGVSAARGGQVVAAAPASAPAQAMQRVAGGAAVGDGQGAQALALAYPDFDAVVALIRRMRDMKLLVEVERHVRLAAYRPGRIEFQPTDDAPRDLAPRLAERLRGWTQTRWGVSVVSSGGGQTLAEVNRAQQEAERQDALRHPLVQAVLAQFPQGRITAILHPPPPPEEPEAASETLGPVDAVEEWDPFEDE